MLKSFNTYAVLHCSQNLPILCSRIHHQENHAHLVTDFRSIEQEGFLWWLWSADGFVLCANLYVCCDFCGTCNLSSSEGTAGFLHVLVLPAG